ncbi:MAG: hypothetical protein GY700_15765, partial [Propionibacteriaceae bacterium]|nr:hypothetical protein [Propionibacteriaceae bacterium]
VAVVIINRVVSGAGVSVTVVVVTVVGMVSRLFNDHGMVLGCEMNL